MLHPSEHLPVVCFALFSCFLLPSFIFSCFSLCHGLACFVVLSYPVPGLEKVHADLRWRRFAQEIARSAVLEKGHLRLAAEKKNGPQISRRRREIFPRFFFFALKARKNFGGVFCILGSNTMSGADLVMFQCSSGGQLVQGAG